MTAEHRLAAILAPGMAQTLDGHRPSIAAGLTLLASLVRRFVYAVTDNVIHALYLWAAGPALTPTSH